MKIALRLVALSMLVVISTFYAGCKKDDDGSKTVEQQQLEKLVGDWAIVTASDDNGDRTPDFQNPQILVLHITGNYTGEGKQYNYSFTGTRPDPSPWPESGFWMFGANKATDIIRDPDTVNEIEMNYSVTATNLTIEFNVPDGAPNWPGGTSRVKNVLGDWTFTFEKQ